MRKVLIHGVAMRKQGGGSRHLRGFVDALGRLDPDSEYLLCLDRQFEFPNTPTNMRIVPVTVHSQWQRFWWDQIIMPRFVREQSVDLILAIFVFGAYRPPVPQIVFQRNPLFFCKYYLDTVSPFSRWGMEILVRRQMAYRSMLGSAAIVVPSQSTRQMILAYCSDVPAARFHVIPHAFDKSHVRAEQPLLPALQEKLNSASDAARLLYVSHLEPHKDVETALEIILQLVRKGENMRLWLTLDERDDPRTFEALMAKIKAFGLEHVVVNLGRVPEDQVFALYRQADIFLFPSLCESFGFPMKEALYFGLPIVAADTLINREICGDAALYFAPREANAGATQVMRLLKNKPLAAQMRACARERFVATTMDWNTYTQSILNLMHSTLQDSYSHA